VTWLLWITALAATPVTVPAQMRLKDGTIYQLKEAPHLKGGRFVFTTSEGKVFSLAEGEVDEIKLLTPPPAERAALNPHDSHQLGAIAQRERRKKGKYTLIAPAPTARPRRNSAP
jgi:hypothetical protein